MPKAPYMKGMIKEKNPHVYLLYALIIALCFVFGLFFGVAMDDATVTTLDGRQKVEYSRLKMPEISVANLKNHLDREDGKAKTMGIVGALASGIVIAYKTSNKKRLHRKGEEHGNAKWADSAEKRSLQDMVFHLTKYGKKANEFKKQAAAETDPDKKFLLNEKARKIEKKRRCYYYSGAVPVKYAELIPLENLKKINVNEVEKNASKSKK